jgi:hypothetical protein
MWVYISVNICMYVYTDTHTRTHTHTHIPPEVRALGFGGIYLSIYLLPMYIYLYITLGGGCIRVWGCWYLGYGELQAQLNGCPRYPIYVHRKKKSACMIHTHTHTHARTHAHTHTHTHTKLHDARIHTCFGSNCVPIPMFRV